MEEEILDGQDALQSLDPPRVPTASDLLGDVSWGDDGASTSDGILGDVDWGDTNAAPSSGDGDPSFPGVPRVTPQAIASGATKIGRWFTESILSKINADDDAKLAATGVRKSAQLGVFSAKATVARERSTTDRSQDPAVARPKFVTGGVIPMTRMHQFRESEQQREQRMKALKERTRMKMGVEADDLIQTLEDLEAIPMRPETIRFIEDPKSIADMSAQERANVVNELVFSSSLQTAPSIAAGVVGGAVGGPVGAAAAASATGFAVEYSHTIPEAIESTARELYGERDTAYLKDRDFLIDMMMGELPNHDEFLRKTNAYALKKATAIAATDAAAAFAGSKLSQAKLLARARGVSRLLKLTGGVLAEGVTEGAGEALGQKWSSGQIQWGEVAAESLAGGVMGVGGMAGHMYTNRKTDMATGRGRFDIDYEERARRAASAETDADGNVLPVPDQTSETRKRLEKAAREAPDDLIANKIEEFRNAGIETGLRYEVLIEELGRRARGKKSRSANRLVEWALRNEIESDIDVDGESFSVMDGGVNEEYLAKVKMLAERAGKDPNKVSIFVYPAKMTDEEGKRTQPLEYVGIDSVRRSYLSGEESVEKEGKPVSMSEMEAKRVEEEARAEEKEEGGEPVATEEEASEVDTEADTEEEQPPKYSASPETQKAIEALQKAEQKLTEKDSPQQRSAVTRARKKLASLIYDDPFGIDPEEGFTILSLDRWMEQGSRRSEFLDKALGKGTQSRHALSAAMGEEFERRMQVFSEGVRQQDPDPSLEAIFGSDTEQTADPESTDPPSGITWLSIKGEGAPEGGGMSLAEAQDAARKIRRERGHDDVPVYVVRRPEDLANVDRQAYAIWLKSRQSGVEGFYVSSLGRGYVFSDNVQNSQRLAEVLTHETIGHMGLQAVLGSGRGKIMDAMYDAIPGLYDGAEGDLKAIEKTYRNRLKRDKQGGLDERSRRLASEEFLAKFSEKIYGTELSNRGLSQRAANLADELAASMRRFGRNWMEYNIPFRRGDAVSLLRASRNMLANPRLSGMMSNVELGFDDRQAKTETSLDDSSPAAQQQEASIMFSLMDNDDYRDLYLEDADAIVPRYPPVMMRDYGASMQDVREWMEESSRPGTLQNMSDKRFRLAKDQYSKSILAAVSSGKLTLDEAYRKYGTHPDLRPPVELEAMRPVPPIPLWHASAQVTDASTGLKTRLETGVYGVGGGTDNTISVTTSERVARNLLEAMREAKDALNGTLKTSAIAERMRKVGKYDEWARAIRIVSSEIDPDLMAQDQLPRDEYARNRAIIEAVIAMQNIEGRGAYISDRFDGNRLRDLKNADLGLLLLQPNPGAKGEHFPAEREYRLYSGDAVQIIRAETDGGIRDFAHSDLPRTSVGVRSNATGFSNVTLTDDGRIFSATGALRGYEGSKIEDVFNAMRNAGDTPHLIRQNPDDVMFSLPQDPAIAAGETVRYVQQVMGGHVEGFNPSNETHVRYVNEVLDPIARVYGPAAQGMRHSMFVMPEIRFKGNRVEAAYSPAQRMLHSIMNGAAATVQASNIETTLQNRLNMRRGLVEAMEWRDRMLRTLGADNDIYRVFVEGMMMIAGPQHYADPKIEQALVRAISMFEADLLARRKAMTDDAAFAEQMDLPDGERPAVWMNLNAFRRLEIDESSGIADMFQPYIKAITPSPVVFEETGVLLDASTTDSERLYVKQEDGSFRQAVAGEEKETLYRRYNTQALADRGMDLGPLTMPFIRLLSRLDRYVTNYERTGDMPTIPYHEQREIIMAAFPEVALWSKRGASMYVGVPMLLPGEDQVTQAEHTHLEQVYAASPAVSRGLYSAYDLTPLSIEALLIQDARFNFDYKGWLSDVPDIIGQYIRSSVPQFTGTKRHATVAQQLAVSLADEQGVMAVSSGVVSGSINGLTTDGSSVSVTHNSRSSIDTDAALQRILAASTGPTDAIVLTEVSGDDTEFGVAANMVFGDSEGVSIFAEELASFINGWTEENELDPLESVISLYNQDDVTGEVEGYVILNPALEESLGEEVFKDLSVQFAEEVAEYIGSLGHPDILLTQLLPVSVSVTSQSTYESDRETDGSPVLRKQEEVDSEQRKARVSELLRAWAKDDTEALQSLASLHRGQEQGPPLDIEEIYASEIESPEFIAWFGHWKTSGLGTGMLDPSGRPELMADMYIRDIWDYSFGPAGPNPIQRFISDIIRMHTGSLGRLYVPVRSLHNGRLGVTAAGDNEHYLKVTNRINLLEKTNEEFVAKFKEKLEERYGDRFAVDAATIAEDEADGILTPFSVAKAMMASGVGDARGIRDAVTNVLIDMGYDGIGIAVSTNGAMKGSQQVSTADEHLLTMPLISPAQARKMGHGVQPMAQMNLSSPFRGMEEAGILAEFEQILKDSSHPYYAPNGKRSNLTPAQWLVVRTRAFKRVFGDWEGDPANASALLDENGEPLKMYHGTSAPVLFQGFRGSDREGATMDQQLGSHHAPSRVIADGFAKANSTRVKEESLSDELKAAMRSPHGGSLFKYFTDEYSDNDVPLSRVIPTFGVAKKVLDVTDRQRRGGHNLSPSGKDFDSSQWHEDNRTIEKTIVELMLTNDGREVDPKQFTELVTLMAWGYDSDTEMAWDAMQMIDDFYHEFFGSGKPLVPSEVSGRFMAFRDKWGGPRDPAAIALEIAARIMTNGEKSAIGLTQKMHDAIALNSRGATSALAEAAKSWLQANGYDAIKYVNTFEGTNFNIDHSSIIMLEHTTQIPVYTMDIISQNRSYDDVYFSISDIMGESEMSTRMPSMTEFEELLPPDIRAELQAQMDMVPEVRNAEGRLVAPNGEVSKLTEKRWKQVRTPFFKNWFGDWENDPASASKVVDENGEPLVVYHGTSDLFYRFNRRYSNPRAAAGPGFYFTTSRGDAEYNYADPDSLEKSVSRQIRAEEISSLIDNDPDNIGDLVREYGQDFVNGVTTYMSENRFDTLEEAIAATLRDQDGQAYRVIPSFLNIRRPFIHTLSYNNATKFISDPDYYKDFGIPSLQEALGQHVPLQDFIRAIEDVLHSGPWESMSGDPIDVAAILERAGITMYEHDLNSLDNILMNSQLQEEISDNYLMWESGRQNAGEIVIWDALVEMGFDGVYMPDASRRFNMGNDYTGEFSHWIAYHPAKVKSADNTGLFGHRRVGMDRSVHDIPGDDIMFSLPPGSRGPKATSSSMPTSSRIKDPVTYYDVIDAIQRALQIVVVRDRSVPSTIGARVDKKTGAIIAKNLGHVEIIAREMGKIIHKRIFHDAVVNMPKKSATAILDEVSKLSTLAADKTTGKKTGKRHQQNGVGQFMRLWMTDPAAAQAAAPKYYALVESVLSQNNLAGDLYAIRDLIQSLGARDALSIIKSGIVPSRGPSPVDRHMQIGGKRTKLLTRFVQKWLDTGFLVKVAQEEILFYEKNNRIAEILSRAEKEKWSRTKTTREVNRVAGEQLLADQDAYVLWRLQAGNGGKARVFIKHGISTLGGLNPITGQPGRTVSLSEAIAPVNHRIADFEAYAVTRRAREIMDQIDRGERSDDYEFPQGYTSEVVDEVLAAYAKDRDAKAFEKAFDMLQEYNEGIIRLAQHEGLLSSDEADRILKMNTDYIPWHRVNPNLKETKLEGKIAGRVGKGIMSLRRGSEAPISQPLVSVVAQTHKIVDAIERNRTLAALYRHIPQDPDDIMDNPGLQRWIRPVSRPVAVKHITAAWEKIIEQLRNDPSVSQSDLDNLIKNSGDIQDVVTMMVEPVYQMSASGRPSDTQVATVRVDGETKYFEMPTELWEAVMKFNPTQNSAFLRVLSAPARMLRRGATAWNPGFLVPNIARDTLTRIAQSNRDVGLRTAIEAFDPFILSMEYIGDVVGLTDNDVRQMYTDFMASGAYGATITSMDRSFFKDNAMSIAMSAGGVKGVITHPLSLLRAMGESHGGVLGWLGDSSVAQVTRGSARALHQLTFKNVERANDLTENINRFTEFRATYRNVYERMLADGHDDNTARREATQQAALAARDVTIDFARMGQYMQILNRIVPFSNAIIQGTYRVAESMASNPQRALFATGFFITLSSVFYALSGDNPWYEEQPEYIRDLYWLMPNYAGPRDTNDNPMTFVRIPKPHLWGLVSASAFERTMSWMKYERPETWREYMRSLGGQLPIDPFVLTDDRLPFTARVYNSIDNLLGVQAAMPVIEVVAGQDLFRHRPIEPYYMAQNREPSQRYDITDSPTALYISRSIEKMFGGTVGPRVIEHLIYGYTAGLGNMVVTATDEYSRIRVNEDYGTKLAPLPTSRTDMGTIEATIDALEAFVDDPKEGAKKMSGLGFTAFDNMKTENLAASLAMAPSRAIVKGFIVDQPGYAAMSVRDFFHLREKSSRAYNTYKERLNSESEESAKLYYENNEDLIKAHFATEGFDPAMDGVTSAIRVLMGNYGANEESARVQLDRLYETMVRVANAGLRAGYTVMDISPGVDYLNMEKEPEETEE